MGELQKLGFSYILFFFFSLRGYLANGDLRTQIS